MLATPFFLVLEIVGRVPLLETVVGVDRVVAFACLAAFSQCRVEPKEQIRRNRFGGFAQAMISRKIQLMVSLTWEGVYVFVVPRDRLGVCLGVEIWKWLRLLGMITHISR